MSWEVVNNPPSTASSTTVEYKTVSPSLIFLIGKNKAASSYLFCECYIFATNEVRWMTGSPGGSTVWATRGDQSVTFATSDSTHWVDTSQDYYAIVLP